MPLVRGCLLRSAPVEWFSNALQEAHPRDTMVGSGRPRWFIEQLDAHEPNAARWIWRCVDTDRRLSAESPTRFKTFLDAYADAKKNGMDTHDFVAKVSQRSG